MTSPTHPEMYFSKTDYTKKSTFFFRHSKSYTKMLKINASNKFLHIQELLGIRLNVNK